MRTKMGVSSDSDNEIIRKRSFRFPSPFIQDLTTREEAVKFLNENIFILHLTSYE